MNNSYKNYIGMRLQNLSAARRIFRVFAIFSLSLVARPSLLSAQDQTSIPEVTKDLSGIANVYLLASSTSVGDPRLPHQIAEFASLQGVSFAVVHFNNGLHGWGYTKAQFKSGFPIFLQAIRALPGRGKLIWTTITPVKPEASNGATNPRIDARNAIAQAFIESEKILVDDQHALMTQHADLYEDAFHFNKAGSAIMGGQAAAIIKNALESSRPGQRGQPVVDHP